MTHTITLLTFDEVIEVEADETILEIAVEENIPLSVWLQVWKLWCLQIQTGAGRSAYAGTLVYGVDG
jgi:hypothetical protein